MMSRRQGLYLLLALTGLVLTWFHNIQFIMATEGSGGFIEKALVNHASSSLSWDVLIAAVTFILWMWHEAGRLAMRGRWLYIVATLGIAVAFAWPFFLFMRERHLVGVANGS